ncbi:hypothetical protein HaLaN_06183 [Haematococcus lacustris]|uniref:Uncharacterized protein n=1 Tax=Haematococcus lacustris TaxID=44745 RepID=A0A699Z5T2_HAELA|nr:hypothetical protein HaLaN_06183 [Haematococcus lacustris]
MTRYGTGAGTGAVWEQRATYAFGWGLNTVRGWRLFSVSHDASRLAGLLPVVADAGRLINSTHFFCLLMCVATASWRPSARQPWLCGDLRKVQLLLGRAPPDPKANASWWQWLLSFLVGSCTVFPSINCPHPNGAIPRVQL